uniref:Putative secreted protein n=1 Tax=Anopheles marajoara TaxID=58244 RepID=A0A2M4CA10_9DIPT
MGSTLLLLLLLLLCISTIQSYSNATSTFKAAQQSLRSLTYGVEPLRPCLNGAYLRVQGTAFQTTAIPLECTNCKQEHFLVQCGTPKGVR